MLDDAPSELAKMLARFSKGKPHGSMPSLSGLPFNRAFRYPTQILDTGRAKHNGRVYLGSSVLLRSSAITRK